VVRRIYDQSMLRIPKTVAPFPTNGYRYFGSRSSFKQDQISSRYCHSEYWRSNLWDGIWMTI